MFINNQTLKADKIPAGKGEELFKQHIAWFTKHFEQGDFLLVGPYTDKEMAGIMIAGTDSREAVEEILKEDVYYAYGIVYVGLLLAIWGMYAILGALLLKMLQLRPEKK